MANEAEKRPRLADLSAEVFAFAFQLKSAEDPGGAEEMKQKVGKLISDFEQAARTGGYKPDSTQSAKYALAAYIDEAVLSSKLPMKDDWAGSPLQLEYFNDFAAGEEFYNKLKQIREGAGEDRHEIAEVYFLCLTHGFKGMYIDLKGMEERRQLLDELSAELKNSMPGDPVNLSVSWQPPDELPKLVQNSPTWIVPAICAVLLIALLITLAFTVNIMADNAAETLTGQEP